jgi:hypothetical protein
MVSKWKQAGRLVLDGHLVLLEPSIAALDGSLHPSRGGHLGGNGTRKRIGQAPDASAPPPASGYIHSKTRQADFSAELLELRLRKERGELHETAGCRQAIAALLSGPLERLRSIGPRIAPALSVETNVRRIETMIDDEIDAALESIAAELRALAPDAPSNGHPTNGQR